MKLSKDQIIKSLIGLVVVLVVVVAVQMMRSDDSDKGEDNKDEVQATDENTESGEEAAIEGDTTTTTPQAKPVTKPTSTTTTKPASTTSSYSSGTCSPSLSAKKDSTYNAILLSWTTCQNDDFQYYKVVKSSTNSNLSYPNDPVVVSSANRSTNNFIDKTVSPRTTYYYRACAVQKINRFTCGNIVSVTY